MIDSVSVPPYRLAVSKKLMPTSRARSMMAMLSASVVRGPKFIVPRQSGLTLSPVRSRLRYSIRVTLPPAVRCDSMPTIDRNRWIRERLQFLDEQLAAAGSDDQRKAIEAEIDALQQERRAGRRWRRRFFGLGLRP